ncbi:broad [Carabus blaptoides fortunei]
MGCEQVCLKWNNFSLNITKNIDDLWKDESLVDVSIISDGQCIQAHKVILSASSPLFKSLFAVNPCQHPVIILQDVRFRELVSIITFIYKGEVNIFEESLPALLQAAKTLQIRGLSDSVDRDSLNRLYALRDEDNERTSKKRKTHNNNSSSSNNSSANTQTNDVQHIEDGSTTNLPEKIIPKEEPKLDNFPVDFLAHVSDDEDVKTADLVLHSDRTQDILQTTDLVASATTDGTHVVGKKMYQHMPFANLLPSSEVLLRWSQSRSLDQLAIDLMKRLFTTEERLICNVNGKMGKPRFHTGKISLLREVLYYYSGLTPVEFELHWKNCLGLILPTDTSTIVSAAAAQVFACPFCPRTYTNWGFRRRHIKTIHYNTGPDGVLPCRLCPISAGARALTLEQWIYHMLDDHQLDSLRVQEDVSVYKEAIMVLQSTSTHPPADNVP